MTNQSHFFYDGKFFYKDKTEVKVGDRVWTYGGYGGPEKDFGVVDEILLPGDKDMFDYTGEYVGGVFIVFDRMGLMLFTNLEEIFFINRKEDNKDECQQTAR